MNSKSVLIVASIICFILIAGCTDTGKNSGGTTEQTTVPIASPLTSAEPGITDKVPSIYEVAVQVEKSTLANDPAITTTFRGGAGMNSLSKISMTVTHPDGSIASGSIDHPLVGNTLTLAGSLGKDRVVIMSELPNGKKYRIYDEYLSYRG